MLATVIPKRPTSKTNKICQDMIAIKEKQETETRFDNSLNFNSFNLNIKYGEYKREKK